MAALMILLIVAAGGAWWYVDVQRRPWKTCRACGGKGRLKGIVPGTHADCRRCEAKGRVPRIGARRPL